MSASLLPIVCDRVRGQVSLLLDGELSQLEQRMVAGHLERCADCREFAAAVRTFTEELRSAPLESPRWPIVVRRTRRVPVSGIQASAAAVIVVGVLGLASQIGVPDHTNRDASQRSSAANLFRATSWQPEVELAQIEPVAGAVKPEDRPGPTSAL
jgi:anti-sigma factor RsiW